METKLTLSEINAMGPLAVTRDERVKDRWIEIHDALWGAGSGARAYDVESRWFNQALSADQRLQKATRFSIFTAFIDLAVCGLSLEPGSRAQCYLLGRNAKTASTGPDGRAQYETRVMLSVSGYGELVMRMRSGQIRHADNPVLVYAEDEFAYGDHDGRKSVSYTCHLPHTSGHIVAAFMRITRADGSADYAVMFEEDWTRLQGYSGKNNRRYDEQTRTWVERPNELYSSNGGNIDPGFLGSKLIKHAFKTYPRVRIGHSTEFETQRDAETQAEVDDFYGVADTPATPTAAPAPEQPMDYVQPSPAASSVGQGVKVQVENDDVF